MLYRFSNGISSSFCFSMAAVTNFHSYPLTKLCLTRTRLLACDVRMKATDRVIDFGKHKGKMLGTLPSTYLKWVSNNLRARDFEEWAKLADQVLEDPIYKDRMEWELADDIMRGNGRTRNEGKGVSELLLEISERFGWDNEDKAGWKSVNFELLGTSKGGRIPRINKTSVDGGETNQNSVVSGKVTVTGGGGGRRRRQRIDRMRMKREAPTPRIDSNVETKERMLDRQRNHRFPGREALLSIVNRKTNSTPSI